MLCPSELLLAREIALRNTFSVNQKDTKTSLLVNQEAVWNTADCKPEKFWTPLKFLPKKLCNITEKTLWALLPRWNSKIQRFVLSWHGIVSNALSWKLGLLLFRSHLCYALTRRPWATLRERSPNSVFPYAKCGLLILVQYVPYKILERFTSRSYMQSILHVSFWINKTV